MSNIISGKIVKSMSALYKVRIISPQTGLPEYTVCPACGAFRHTGEKPLVGDNVELTSADGEFAASAATDKAKPSTRGVMITKLLERKNSLIRPPMANLDILFVMLAAANPTPVLLTTDKLISIAEYNNIEPVIVIGKADLAPQTAQSLAEIYRRGGFTVFVVGYGDDAGIEDIRSFIFSVKKGQTSAFAGASGIGKSTLLNRLFPGLELTTGVISKRIERGKNTTRHVELFTLDSDENGGDSHSCAYIADTPGFAALDFEQFDFFTIDDLSGTMREFSDYIGKCRYTDCSHLKDEGCSVLKAVNDGLIAPSRHESYREMYNTLKQKKYR